MLNKYKKSNNQIMTRRTQRKKKKTRNRKRQVDDYAQSMWVALDRLQTTVRNPSRRPPCETQAARPSLGCPGRAQAQPARDPSHVVEVLFLSL